MQRRPDIYLELALIALRKLPRFLGQRTLQAYEADDLCQSAVERQLEIAGDALGQLRKHAPEVFDRIADGQMIVAFRNVLAHGYAVLDHGKVFEAATSRAPVLLQALERLLAEFPDG
ncbi:MAG: HepT-like ribonuclease domain-containing protein [Pseudomonadota bacterium]